MLLEKASSQDIKAINSVLAKKLIKKPLFMFFCPDINKREEFIDAYLTYYIYEWSRYDQLLYAKESKSLISLVDPDTFAYKFKGKGAHGIRKYKSSVNIFMHRENIASIIDIVVPPFKESRVMTIYANPETDLVDINKLIDEAMEMARRDDFVLIYDTFSRKMLGLLERKGFSIASQKQFMNTQFVETVMMYNI